MNLKNAFVCAVAVSLLGTAAGYAQEKPFRFPAGKHSGGELRYVNDIPVLMVVGSPEEMGEQFGILAVKPMDLNKLLGGVLKDAGLATFKPLLFSTSRTMFAAFPPDHAWPAP